MENCSNYGKVFKKLRKQRGLKLTSFVHVGVSPATLCKFENGKSMINFESLIAALRELSVSLSEYEKFLNNFELTNHEQLIKKIVFAQVTKDIEKLQESHLELRREHEYMCALAVKNIYERLSVDEHEKIVDYFETLELWRGIDLYTLYLMVEYLKPRQISYILEGFFDCSIFLKTLTSLEYRTLFIQIVCHSVIFLSRCGYQQLTQYFLNNISPENFIYSHTMYTKNLYNFTKGYCCAQFKDQSAGEEEMRKALSIFKSLSVEGFLQYYDYFNGKYNTDNLKEER